MILIYHYTGASASVPIYMHIRLCISMHLFLLGYEHFTFSWQKGRTGITRLVQVDTSQTRLEADMDKSYSNF